MIHFCPKVFFSSLNHKHGIKLSWMSPTPLFMLFCSFYDLLEEAFFSSWSTRSSLPGFAFTFVGKPLTFLELESHRNVSVALVLKSLLKIQLLQFFETPLVEVVSWFSHRLCVSTDDFFFQINSE